jgi:glycosyltransferase involved in cell wall biosynthesis
MRDRDQGFSVLISLYAGENPDHVREALDSIVRQSLQPQEILIIKDGLLTRELDEVVDGFAAERGPQVRVIAYEENRGLGRVLAEGVKQCRSGIIARMDADDIAREDRFEKQYRVLMEHPEIDLVGSWIDEFQGDIRHIISVRKVPATYEEIRAFAKKRNPINHPTVMFRKQAVLAAGNYQEMLWFEDYLLWVNMLLNGSKMMNLQESLVYYRVGPEMFQRRGGWRYVRHEWRLQRRLYEKGFISPGEFLRNGLVRTAVRMMPNSLRGMIYKNILRIKP